MNVQVNWLEGMSFEGISPNGFKVPIGTEVAYGGMDDGFRPLELMLISLAGCTGMDVISILQKERQNVQSFSVNITAERVSEHPKVFHQIVIEYVISGSDLDASAVERAVQLSEEKYCPAQAMLRETVNITNKIVIKEMR